MLNIKPLVHFPNLSTNVVVASCMLNIQKCMIHHINQNFTADAKMYHPLLYIECTIIYDHICTQTWRSVSASAALTTAVRVRIRPDQRFSLDLTMRMWLLQKEVGRGPLIFAGRVAPGVLNQLGSEHKRRKRADL